MTVFPLFLVIYCLVNVPTFYSYPGGAPAGVCDTMMPSHGVGSQACQPRYIVESNKTNYGVNESIQIIVRGSSNSDTFRGVLLVAKTQTSGRIVGTWSTNNANLKTLPCESIPNTGITHSSRIDKLQIDANWIAPSTLLNENIIIRATVVKTTQDFYVNCFSLTLTARQTNQSTNGTNTNLTSTTTASPTADVGVNVGWTYSNGVTTLKMRAKNMRTAQWIAMGLSNDDKMGNDHVFMCRYLADNTVTLQRMINPNGYAAPTAAFNTANIGGTFTTTLQKVEDGVVYCEFTLSNFTASTRQRRQANVFTLSQNTDYQPLIAIGPIDGDGRTRKHSSRSAPSSSVRLDRQGTLNFNLQDDDDEKPGLMKAHGIIMIFTWILLVSTGILIAQFFKTAWPERKLCGKALWFALHRAVMGSASILTIVAFILILVYKKGRWVPTGSRVEFAHSIVGILVICFAVIQPVMALFRCTPDARNRFIFNYLHGFLGFSAFLLSIVAIFLAMFFTEFDFRANKEWGIVAAWAGWIFLIFLIFIIVETRFPNRTEIDDKRNSYEMDGTIDQARTKNDRSYRDQSVMKDRIKTILLIVHILVALGLALALAILVGKL